MYDSDMAVQELYRLTVQDATISDRQKKKLLKDYPHNTEQAAAHLIATLLCFALERTFVRRTPGNIEQAAAQHQKCLAVYTQLFPDQPDMLSAKQADLRMLYSQVGAHITPPILRIA